MTPFIDIHTHSNISPPDWSNDTYIVIRNLTQNDWDTEGGQYASQLFSTGLHPWFLTCDNAESDFEKLTQLAENQDFILLGECGLDRLKGEPMDFQMAIFEQQIELAEKLQKPIIIHCVRAFSELIFLKKRLNPSVPMIVHGFNQNEKILNSLIEHDFYISIGAAIFRTDSNAQKLVKKIPLTHLFLETDDSSYTIRTIYVATSEILAKPISYLKTVIYQNYERILEKKPLFK